MLVDAVTATAAAVSAIAVSAAGERDQTGKSSRSRLRPLKRKTFSNKVASVAVTGAYVSRAVVGVTCRG